MSETFYSDRFESVDTACGGILRRITDQPEVHGVTLFGSQVSRTEHIHDIDLAVVVDQLPVEPFHGAHLWRLNPKVDLVWITAESLLRGTVDRYVLGLLTGSKWLFAQSVAIREALTRAAQPLDTRLRDDERDGYWAQCTAALAAIHRCGPDDCVLRGVLVAKLLYWIVTASPRWHELPLCSERRSLLLVRHANLSGYDLIADVAARISDVEFDLLAQMLFANGRRPPTGEESLIDGRDIATPTRYSQAPSGIEYRAVSEWCERILPPKDGA